MPGSEPRSTVSKPSIHPSSRSPSIATTHLHLRLLAEADDGGLVDRPVDARLAQHVDDVERSPHVLDHLSLLLEAARRGSAWGRATAGLRQKISRRNSDEPAISDVALPYDERMFDSLHNAVQALAEALRGFDAEGL